MNKDNWFQIVIIVFLAFLAVVVGNMMFQVAQMRETVDKTYNYVSGVEYVSADKNIAR